LEERTNHRNGLQRVPMPYGIGECVFLNDIKLNEIQSAYYTLIERMVLHNEGIQ